MHMEKNGGIYIVRGTVPIYGEIGILVYCEQHRGYTGGCLKKKNNISEIFSKTYGFVRDLLASNRPIDISYSETI